MTEFVRDIHLHGALGERFGQLHRLAVASPAEAVRALALQLRGFRQAIEAGRWKIIHGPIDAGAELGERELKFGLGRLALHIVPVLAGAGIDLGAVGKIVGGLAIAAAAFALGPAGFLGADAILSGTIAQAGIGIGISMSLGGATSLLTAKPVAANGRGGVDERASFIFNGPENVSAQGGAVPIVIGRMLVGSVVVSAGLAAEQAP